MDVGAYGGREGDSNVFKKSPFRKQPYENQLNVPGVGKLPNDDNGQERPFVIVADEVFGLHEKLLRPYPRKYLDVQNKVFD